MERATSCSYTHDVGGDAFDDLAGEEWHCPHERYADSEYCVFHQPVRSLAERGVTPELVSESLVAAVEADDVAKNRLLGAVCPGLDLEYLVVGSDSNHPIDLRESWFLGTVDCQRCRLDRVVQFDRSVFESLVVFEDSVFAASASFSDAEFRADANFNLATFRRWADFKNTTFRGQARFRGVIFSSGLFGVNLEFHDAADFMSAQFEGVANMYDSTFQRGGLFASTTFRGDAKFIECDFRGPVAVGSNFVDDPAMADTKLPYRDGEITDTALVISSSRCVGDLQLDETTADATLTILDTRIEGDVQIQGAESATDETITVDFQNIDSVSGTIEITEEHVFDFSGSVLSEVTFERIEAVDPDLDNFRFTNTEFDGFDFGAYKSLFQRLGWRIHSESSTNVFERENTYLRAKNGAIGVGENAAAREFHFREMLNRGWAYRQQVFATTDADSGVRSRLHFTRKWLSNQVLRYTCGYGERPGRVIYSSVVVIALYAAVYSWLGVDLTYRGPAAVLAFSFQSFNALVLGIPEVAAPLLGVIVASEAFVGPFFIALFVFSITQSLGR